MAAASANSSTGTAGAGVTASASAGVSLHEKADLLAVCVALNLPLCDESHCRTDAELLDHLLEAVRDIPSLMKRHSRDELVGACQALGLPTGGNKTVLSTRLHDHLWLTLTAPVPTTMPADADAVHATDSAEPNAVEPVLSAGSVSLSSSATGSTTRSESATASGSSASDDAGPSVAQPHDTSPRATDDSVVCASSKLYVSSR